MSDQYLPPELSEKLAALYARMEDAYDIVAKQLDFTCEGCPDNCCDSFFLHHTYVEWAYLWEGLSQLPEDKLALIKEQAAEYVAQSERELARDERPQINCPLLVDGLCGLYKHRLMICRMHGVPSSLTFPNGQVKNFPGCFRCQEIVAGRSGVPAVERSTLLRDLAKYEQEFLAENVGVMPKVKKTIAEMIILGPPRV